MKRAAIIVTEGRYIDGVTRPRGDDTPNDVLAHLWLEASEQLLADLRDAIECMDAEVSWARSLDDRDPEAARLKQVAARLRAALPKEDTNA